MNAAIFPRSAACDTPRMSPDAAASLSTYQTKSVPCRISRCAAEAIGAHASSRAVICVARGFRVSRSATLQAKVPAAMPARLQIRNAVPTERGIQDNPPEATDFWSFEVSVSGVAIHDQVSPLPGQH